MAREAIDNIIDLSNRDDKRRLMTSIGAMSGLYEVTIKPKRNLRSLRQNAYYWSCVAAPLAQYLSAQDYNITTPDEAHEVLKAKFLAVSIVNKSTGEVFGKRVRSSTELTTTEFWDYVERSRAWLLDFFGIITADPGEYRVIESAKECVA